MNYLRFILIILFIISAVGVFWNYAKRLKKDYLRRIIERILLETRSSLPADVPYSSETAIQTAAAAAKLPKADLKRLTAVLKKRDGGALIRFWEKQNNKNLAQNLKSLCGKIKKRIPYQNKKAQQAAVLLQEARENLNEGDLLSASEKSSRAAKIFNKLNYVYEEAEAYLLMGTIYRVSAVFDVADFMLRTAAKVFHYLGARNKEAESLGTLGMLMTTQKRFDEARADFEKAESLFAECGQEAGRAEIVNQRALGFLLEEKIPEAVKEAGRALKEHTRLGNLPGQALSLEIGAYADRAQHRRPAAAKKAKKAALLYQKTGNRPAYLEMRFLQAETLFAEEKYAAAEKILREIIEEDKKRRSCFQVANSYNLLGLIYLLQKDLGRARALFSQSLNCELRSERTLGALIDYANMANLETQTGNAAQAQKYLRLAIDYARELEEKELLEILENRLIQNEAASSRRETRRRTTD